MEPLTNFLWFALAAVAYFLPTAIAYMRSHHNLGAIWMLNIFLGWTFLGWIVAIIWSMTRVIPDETAEVAEVAAGD